MMTSKSGYPERVNPLSQRAVSIPRRLYRTYIIGMTTNDTITDSQNNGQPRFWQSGFFLSAVGGLLWIGLLIGTVRWIGGPVIRAETLKKLRGATRAEVRQTLGEPAQIQDYGDWI